MHSRGWRQSQEFGTRLPRRFAPRNDEKIELLRLFYSGFTK
ncbi:hypothetical protein RFEPED_1293 [Rickettsia felis str. Pedreira]|uniref:Uncharacterized protein n=1 Tax=Rickettsia felis str. Pedreira TaxID=1359196 RepID=A0A0F3MSY3_RICFI|nr:hypothetical protein [Rickettsia felis]KJV58898.1 hypothetical protein RFEPED_1293 [Rickettsia felis str. Pedreira]